MPVRIAGRGESYRNYERSDEMGDEVRNKDDAKGRVKEAAGDLTGDDEMKREGKLDQATGRAKDGVEKVADKVREAMRKD
jgi:uncharacterized protein YjbJ (UPF0337 family)